jgi:hypothetical protein
VNVIIAYCGIGFAIGLFVAIVFELGRGYEAASFEHERQALLRALYAAEAENLRHRTRHTN